MHHVHLVSVVICIIFAPYASSWDLLDKIRQEQIKQHDLQNALNYQNVQLPVTKPPDTYISPKVASKIFAVIRKMCLPHHKMQKNNLLLLLWSGS